MDIRDYLHEGDKVNIEKGEDIYSSMVEEILDFNAFYISEIWYKQRKVKLEIDEVIKTLCITKSGLLAFDSQVVGEGQSGNVPLIELVALTDPVKFQRRAGYRAKVMLDIRIGEMAETYIPGDPIELYSTKTADISETGMLFFTDKIHERDKTLLCEINLNRFGNEAPPIRVRAEIKRYIYPTYRGGPYKVGVHFVGVPESSRLQLAKFVMLSQVKGGR